jgi:hypothetical protein
MYTYSIRAYQTLRTGGQFLFEVDSSPFQLSSLQLNDVQVEMTARVQNTINLPGSNFDDISPYPFLSQKLYGHDKFDWMLAAMNVKAAVDRGETRVAVRRFSYLGAQLSFVREQMSTGKFFKPINPDEIVQNIVRSISTFGVSQVLADVIETTGLDLFFGPKEDTSPNDQFKRATTLLDASDLGQIGIVLSAIDADTATVDINVLTNNLLTMSSGREYVIDPASSPTEIAVPESSKNDLAEDTLQFVGKFQPGEQILDLATFDGISQFVRTIRLFFDMSPNRTTFSIIATNQGSPDVIGEAPPTIPGGLVFNAKLIPGGGDTR